MIPSILSVDHSFLKDHGLVKEHHTHKQEQLICTFFILNQHNNAYYYKRIRFKESIPYSRVSQEKETRRITVVWIQKQIANDICFTIFLIYLKHPLGKRKKNAK